MRKTNPKYWASKIIINVMVNGGFMNGWFGDTSDEFRSDQACALRNLSRDARKAWLERNRFNLTFYCRVPEHVFQVLM